MTWVRIDDSLPWHPRMLDVPARGVGAFTLCLCYSARYLTDGLVPYAALPMLRIDDDDVAPLIRAEILIEEDEGLRIRDYLDYQPSAETVRERREAEAHRKRTARASAKRPSGRPTGRDGNVRGESGSPIPSHPIPSRGSNAAAAALATLIEKLQEAGLTARWDRLSAEQIEEVELLVLDLGVSRLVKAAQSVHRPDAPASFAQAWIPIWRETAATAKTRSRRSTSERCPKHGTETPCRSCAAESKAGIA